MTNSRTPSPPGSNEMKPATVAKQTHANVKGKSEKVISVAPIPLILLWAGWLRGWCQKERVSMR